MNVIIEEVVSEFPVEVTEVVVVVEVSDAVSFLELTDVADNTYTGKDGYVPTVNEATGKMELKPQTGGGGGGGGAVSSVFSRTGAVVAQSGDYNADQITETVNKVFVSPTEKANIGHANRSILDQITEAFTTALKTSYDGAVLWISTNEANVISAYDWVTTNGANVLNHIASTSNPHNVTKSQVGLGNVQNVDTTTSSNVAEGSRLYFTTARVLATVLSGLSVASGGAIVDTDTVLVAFGKLQNQINAVPGLINSALASFKTANFLDATSSIQTQLDNRVGFLFKNTTQTVVTGTTGEVIIYAEEVLGNSISNNTILSFKNRNYRSPRAGTCVYKLYINTVDNLSGSPVQIGRSDVSVNQGSNPFEREYLIKDNTLSGFQFNAGVITDSVAGNVGQSTTTYNINTTYYWILTAQPNTSSDSLTHSFSILERI